MIFDKGAKIIKIIDAEEDDNEDPEPRKREKLKLGWKKNLKNTKKWSTKLRISTSRNCLQE